MKREWAARVFGASGLRTLATRLLPWSGILSLNYHRIGVAGSSPFDHGLWSASVEAFDRQVAWLKAHFDVIRPQDLPCAQKTRKGRFVLLTFDDGYRDNYTNAFPVLTQYGIPATFFITTGFLDNPRLAWWDEVAYLIRTCPREQIDLRPWIAEPIRFDHPTRERNIRTVLATYKSLPGNRTDAFLGALANATGTGRFPPSEVSDVWMTWEMVREMHKAGMEIGGHTVNHPILSRLPADEQLQEIRESVNRLRTVLGGSIQSFSYPNGDIGSFNDETRASLRSVGIEYAFSYYGGYRTFDQWDPLDIRRVSVESDTSLSLFKGMVAIPQLFGRMAG